MRTSISESHSIEIVPSEVSREGALLFSGKIHTDSLYINLPYITESIIRTIIWRPTQVLIVQVRTACQSDVHQHAHFVDDRFNLFLEGADDGERKGDEVERVLDRFNENRQLADFLKGMRELFVESLK